MARKSMNFNVGGIKNDVNLTVKKNKKLFYTVYFDYINM